jgi:hypothetical protein
MGCLSLSFSAVANCDCCCNDDGVLSLSMEVVLRTENFIWWLFFNGS